MRKATILSERARIYGAALSINPVV